MVSVVVLFAVLSAAPVESSLLGAPDRRPRLALTAAPLALPDDWYPVEIRRNSLLLPDWATSPGPAAGVVCALRSTSPAWYLQLWNAPRAPQIIDGGTSVFAPLVPGRPARGFELLLKFNNAHGKSVLQELFLGVISAGFSTLRLIPDVVKRWPVPTKLPATFAGAWGAIECRAVSRQDVDQWAEAELAQLEACTDYRCLGPATAKLGPWDERVERQARKVQALVLEERTRQLSSATRSVHGLTVVDAPVHCLATTCALELSWRNDSAFPVSLAALTRSSFEGVDSLGRAVSFGSAALQSGTLAPGASVSLVYRTFGAPIGTVALTFRPEWPWTMPVPGVSWLGGSLITAGPPRCEEGVTRIPLTQTIVRAESLRPTRVVLADGSVAWPSQHPGFLEVVTPGCQATVGLEFRDDARVVLEAQQSR